MRARPATLTINAWTGRDRPALIAPADDLWTMPKQTRAQAQVMAHALAPDRLADPRDWRSDRVGWGLVLPDDPDLDATAKARGDDAPEPLRALLKARGGAPVLRWSRGLRDGHLQRYYPDGGGHSRATAAADFGIGHGQIPRYLLIYATPEQIPWSVQYSLNLSCYVGRLTLTGDALARYVAALTGEWTGADARRDQAVVWSTDHGRDDITWLMGRAIGRTLAGLLQGDSDIAGASWLTGANATGNALGEALRQQAPALVCTTSHGMAGPLDDAPELRRLLGAPVDQQHRPTLAEDLRWRPAGAIWYAHACCSAGSDASTRYAGLVDVTDPVGATLGAIAEAAGARVAPLPEALLGADQPLRAFVGHVEPTFDWTLRDPVDRTVLTHTIVQCLYDRLYQADRPSPIGWALADIFSESARFYGDWQTARVGAAPLANDIDPLYQQLVALDRQTLVILGDPTVTLPP